MKFSLFNFSKEDKTKTVQPVETKKSPGLFIPSNFSQDVKYDYTESVDYSTRVIYNTDRGYNQKLLYLLDNSSLHNSIVIGKAQMVAGTEWIIDGVNIEEWKLTKSISDIIQLTTFFENGYNESWVNLKLKMATDLTISGSYALIVNWSYDFTKIIKTTYIPWYKVNPYERHYDEKTKTWSGVLKYRVLNGVLNGIVLEKDIQAFDINSHLPNGLPALNGKRPNTLEQESLFFQERGYNHEQLIFVKNYWPDREYLGRPLYEGAIRDINTDIELSKYSSESIGNGFLTKAIINVETDGTMSDEQATAMSDRLIENIHNQTIAVSFGPKIEITPVMVENIDSQITAHREDIQKRIISGHAIPAEMVSIFIPGLLGNGDLDIKWNSFYNMIILPQKRMVESTINMIAQINGISNKIEVFSKNPTK